MKTYFHFPPISFTLYHSFTSNCSPTHISGLLYLAAGLDNNFILKKILEEFWKNSRVAQLYRHLKLSSNVVIFRSYLSVLAVLFSFSFSVFFLLSIPVFGRHRKSITCRNQETARRTRRCEMSRWHHRYAQHRNPHNPSWVEVYVSGYKFKQNSNRRRHRGVLSNSGDEASSDVIALSHSWDSDWAFYVFSSHRMRRMNGSSIDDVQP